MYNPADTAEFILIVFHYPVEMKFGDLSKKKKKSASKLNIRLYKLELMWNSQYKSAEGQSLLDPTELNDLNNERRQWLCAVCEITFYASKTADVKCSA